MGAFEYHRDQNEKLHTLMLKAHGGMIHTAESNFKKILLILQTRKIEECEKDAIAELDGYIASIEKCRSKLREVWNDNLDALNRIKHNNGCDGTCNK